MSHQTRAFLRMSISMKISMRCKHYQQKIPSFFLVSNKRICVFHASIQYLAIFSTTHEYQNHLLYQDGKSGHAKYQHKTMAVFHHCFFSQQREIQLIIKACGHHTTSTPLNDNSKKGGGEKNRILACTKSLHSF